MCLIYTYLSLSLIFLEKFSCKFLLEYYYSHFSMAVKPMSSDLNCGKNGHVDLSQLKHKVFFISEKNWFSSTEIKKNLNQNYFLILVLSANQNINYFHNIVSVFYLL